MKQIQSGAPIILFLLAACGSSPDGTNKPPINVRERNVELYSWWSAPSEAGALDKIFEVFQREHPDVVIHNAANDQSGMEARAEMRQRRVDGDPPDLFQLNPHDLQGWVAFSPDEGAAPRNTLQPVDELLASTGAIGHLPADLIDVVSKDDGGGRKAYAVPINLHRHNGMFYNKRIFADLGMSPPASIEEFFQVCRAIKARNEGRAEAEQIAPLAMSRQGWIIGILFKSVIAGTGGVQYLRDLMWGNADPAHDPQMRRAVENMNELFSCANQPADESFGWDAAAGLLESGKAAMYIHGDWAKGELVAQGAAPGLDFDVVAAFGTDELFLYNVDGFAMFTDAPHPEEARLMMATMLSVEAQAEFNKIKGSSPARDDVPLDGFDAVAIKTIEDLRTADFVESVERDASKFHDNVAAALAAFWIKRGAVGFDPQLGLEADVGEVMAEIERSYPLLAEQF